MVLRAGRYTELLTATVPVTGPTACPAPRVIRNEPRFRSEVTTLLAKRFPLAVPPGLWPSSVKVSLSRATLCATTLRSPSYTSTAAPSEM